MRTQARFSVLAALVALLAASATVAEARCTRLAFSVNDYGKEGPIRDAKALLDKYIASWTMQNGITKYTVGKKDVSCELFLDLIVFDEYTCKASASVCWPDNQGPKGPLVATEGGAPTKEKAKSKAPAKRKAPPAKQAGAAAPASKQ